MPWHIEELLQLFEIAERIGEPPFVFDCADIKITRVSKEVDHMGQPSVFADLEIETVAGLDRARDLGGIAQAEHDLGRQFEIVEDLVPDRHQPHRARVFKAEIAVAHPPLEKCDDLSLYRKNTGVRPPCHRQ